MSVVGLSCGPVFAVAIASTTAWLAESLTSPKIVCLRFNHVVGASGAIFGLFGALAIVGKRIGADIRSILVIIGINFFIGFAMGGVDWHAHLGGLIGGVVAAQLVMQRR